MTTEEMMGAPELILKVKSGIGLRARSDGLISTEDADISPLSDLLHEEGATIDPLFGTTEERLEAQAASLAAETEREVPDLSRYYRIRVSEERMEDLAERLNELETVEAAYVKPPAELAEAEGGSVAINDMSPLDETPPVHTPDFTSRQGYLDAAPGGIDAQYAWRFAGGDGDGVDVIDIEGGWNFAHEDLLERQGGVVGGNAITYGDILGESDPDRRRALQRWFNHGTAVIGEIGGDRNDFGVTGICPDADVSAVSFFGLGTEGAIHHAANRLHRGDVLLIELHRPGPRHDFESRDDQKGYIAIEWWPDDWDAICYAVARGVIVVEAAGNGAENLDDSLYDQRPSGFPADWSNPFRRGSRDSGAILVGAGAPPSGRSGPDRSRLEFSNYGAAVDAQGWGREVTTTGYGNLQGGGPNQNEWYTHSFGGTSSASPIVVGALGCVQGVLRRYGHTPLSPLRARSLLRSTGSPQQDAPGRPRSQRIGNRPDLRELIPAAFRTRTWTGVQFRGTVPANSTRRWFTHSWPAQRHVLWTVVPTTPQRGAPQIEWDVQVERASHSDVTYWISITNTTSSSVGVEARYAVLGET